MRRISDNKRRLVLFSTSLLLSIILFEKQRVAVYAEEQKKTNRRHSRRKRDNTKGNNDANTNNGKKEGIDNSLLITSPAITPSIITSDARSPGKKNNNNNGNGIGKKGRGGIDQNMLLRSRQCLATIVVANQDDGSLSILDPKNGDILIRHIDIPYNSGNMKKPRPIDVVTRNGLLYISDYNNNRIVIMDGLEYITVGSITVGSQPTKLSIDATGTHMYVLNEGDNTATILNLVSRVSLGVIESVDRVAVEPVQDDNIPVQDDVLGQDDDITVRNDDFFDTSSGDIEEEFPFSGVDYRIHDVLVAADGHSAYVSYTGGNNGLILLYDDEGRVDTFRENIGNNSTFAINMLLNSLYVLSEAQNTFQEYFYYAVNNFAEDPISMDSPTDSVTSPDGRYIYISSRSFDRIYTYDVDNVQLMSILPTEVGNPSRLAHTGDRLFVTHGEPYNSVSVYEIRLSNPIPRYIRTTTSKLVFSNPFGIAYYTRNSLLSTMRCGSPPLPTISPSPTRYPTPLPSSPPSTEPSTLPSDTPSTCRSVSKIDGMLEFINSIIPTTLDLTDTPDTAQYKAFKYIVDNCNSDDDQIQLVRLYSLVVFYHSAGGSNWNDKSNWLDATTNMCEWSGVECANNENEITTLQASNNNLIGKIPEELGLLAELTDLQLGNNGLTEKIPSQLGLLTELDGLNLEDNTLTGAIPGDLGLLSELLTDLRLGSNELTEKIPSQLGDLIELTWLDLSNNKLEGEIPNELGKLVNLGKLYLWGNDVTGVIPGILCTNTWIDPDEVPSINCNKVVPCGCCVCKNS